MGYDHKEATYPTWTADNPDDEIEYTDDAAEAWWDAAMADAGEASNIAGAAEGQFPGSSSSNDVGTHGPEDFHLDDGKQFIAEAFSPGISTTTPQGGTNLTNASRLITDPFSNEGISSPSNGKDKDKEKTPSSSTWLKKYSPMGWSKNKARNVLPAEDHELYEDPPLAIQGDNHRAAGQSRSENTALEEFYAGGHWSYLNEDSHGDLDMGEGHPNSPSPPVPPSQTSNFDDPGYIPTSDELPDIDDALAMVCDPSSPASAHAPESDNAARQTGPPTAPRAMRLEALPFKMQGTEEDKDKEIKVSAASTTGPTQGIAESGHAASAPAAHRRAGGPDTAAGQGRSPSHTPSRIRGGGSRSGFAARGHGRRGGHMQGGGQTNAHGENPDRILRARWQAQEMEMMRDGGLDRFGD